MGKLKYVKKELDSTNEMINKIKSELDWCKTEIGVQSYRNYKWPTMLAFMRKKI